MHYSFIEIVHIITGAITFFVGPWQFVPWIRHNAINLHRLMGKTYVLCVFVSAPTGFVISFNTDLMLAAAGTAFQCVLWLLFTWLAYQNIRNKRIAKHRRWMIRSYGLVLAAPMVRIYIVILEALTDIRYKDNFDALYPVFVWLSFLPLGIAELIIRCRPDPKPVNGFV